MTTAEQSATWNQEGVPAERRSQFLKLLPWFLLALCVIGAIAVVVLTATGQLISESWYALVLMVPAAVGALVASRVPRNPIGWMLLALALGEIVETIAEGYAATSPPDPDAVLAVLAAWLAAWVWMPAFVLGGVFVPLLFPNGSFVSPRWRYVGWLAATGALLMVIDAAFAPGQRHDDVASDNPVGVDGLGNFLNVLAIAGAVMVASAFIAAGASQVVRFRRSRGEEREQLKWFAFVAGFLVVGITLAFLSLMMDNDRFYIAGAVGWFTAILGIGLGLPVAIGIAILRYRLYDIDWIINRTLVYVPLTAILAGLFVASTTLVRTVFTDLTDTGSDASTAASTLAVVALLTPLKNRLQAFVDKYFKENRDPAKELAKLGQQAQSAAELLDYGLFVRRFLVSSVAALEAQGGCIRVEDGSSRRFEEGDCDSPPAVSLPIRHEGRELGWVEVGPCKNGRPYTKGEIEALQRSVDSMAYLLSLKLTPLDGAPIPALTSLR